MIPQVDFEVEELALVLLEEGPRRGRLNALELQRVLDAHLQFNLRLAADGRLLTAGAVLDAGGERRLTGLGFSRLAPTMLAELIATDPSVSAGVEIHWIARFLYPKGSLAFPGSKEE